MPARRGLGAYGADDRESWRRSVNQLNVSSRALDDLADAKFEAIFPQERRDQILDQPIGQVWYALAQDSVEDLNSGRVLERVEFDQGAFRQRLSGQLAPGEGRVFVLDLQAGQNLRLNLQAPQESILMSLYLPEPTQEMPFLLSDSSETTWSGRLVQSGYYEVAIASKSSNPLNYALNIAVDNIRTVPPEEPVDDEASEQPDETTPDSEEPTDTPVDNTPDNEATEPENPDNDPNDAQETDAPEAPSVEF